MEVENTEVVESTTNNNLALAKIADISMTDISMDLFGDSKTKRITSMDLKEEENQDLILNSIQQADYKINDEIGQEIEVIGCVLTETPTQTTNEETGEIIERKKHSVILFDSEGFSHVTGSNPCYLSFLQIIALKGKPTRDNPLVLIPVKAPAKIKGHEYLRLRIKTNK